MESEREAAMSEIDYADDDALRFVQRVLESDAPPEDRKKARDMLAAIRTRVLKARAAHTEAVSDAQRMDWLERHFTRISGVYVAADHSVLPFAVDCGEDTFRDVGTRIRDAVDAAIRQQQEGEPG